MPHMIENSQHYNILLLLQILLIFFSPKHSFISQVDSILGCSITRMINVIYILSIFFESILFRLCIYEPSVVSQPFEIFPGEVLVVVVVPENSLCSNR